MSNCTVEIDRAKAENIAKDLVKEGFVDDGIKSQYEIFRFKKNGTSIIYYSSGKLLLQGKNAQEYHDKIFGQKIERFEATIGSDEVGKGDYFGPMVVVSCYADSDTQKYLKDLGVTDSKKLSDVKIIELAEKITKKVDHEVEIIQPSQFNELIRQYKNIAIVLAKAHSKALNKLFNKVREQDLPLERVVVDQFSKSKNRLLNELGDSIDMKIDQMHHAESNNIVVASASILARWIFLDEWERMQDKYNFVFPKGASDVIGQGKVFVDEFGSNELEKVAKVFFKTTKSILENELL